MPGTLADIVQYWIWWTTSEFLRSKEQTLDSLVDIARCGMHVRSDEYRQMYIKGVAISVQRCLNTPEQVVINVLDHDLPPV